MRFDLVAFLAVFFILKVDATSTGSWAEERSHSEIKSQFSPMRKSMRPEILVHPKQNRMSPHQHGNRTRTCYVESSNNASDDSHHILSAIKSCNNGGHVIFRKGVNYTIGTALNLTDLKSIDLDIQGNIQFTNDTDYWQANAFKQYFQNATTFFQLGGSDVMMYGGGTINGNGQVWYDLYAANPYILRPILMGVIGLHDSSISDLKLRYSPQWYHLVANSSNVIFDNIDISGSSMSSNVAKNTDGWDTYRSSDITIQNSNIDNGDDCVSFKPNSTNILVQNLACNGSHGISVGSLGQYPGEYDIVENIYVYNVSMSNASDGARIKVWANTASGSDDLQGGGGSGAVSNITYDTMTVSRVDYAIEINQCYEQSNASLCLEYPSLLTISDIVFRNFVGTTTSKYAPNVASFACSSPDVCNGISAENINVVSPNGTSDAYCLNVDQSMLNVTCVTTT